MTAAEAIAMADKMLRLNDPYEVAKLLVQIEGAAKKEAIHEFAERLIADEELKA